MGLRVYLGLVLVGNLTWEILHLPLYTIWTTGSMQEVAFAVVHCTLGDLLIAIGTLTFALQRSLYARSSRYVAEGDQRLALTRLWGLRLLR
jgi:hypothetical protein